MNIEGVNHQFPKFQLAPVFEEKKHDVNTPNGLIQSAIEASEKILANIEPTSTEVHVDLDV
jgi:hypothetical protein